MKEFHRIRRDTKHDGIGDKYTLKGSIDASRVRADISKHNYDESDRLIKASYPGSLKNQKDWIAWSLSIRNYLPNILRQNGVPLRYVICENPDPKYYGEDEEACDFEQMSINYAPFYRVVYNNNARKVRQMIHAFLQGETSET